MNASESHRSYDLFKLLVALSLLVIWILLMLRAPQLNQPVTVAPAAAMTSPLPPESSPTVLPQPSATLSNTSTATAKPPATLAPTSTATLAPAATSAISATQTSTEVSAALAVTETAATPSPTAATTSTPQATPVATASVAAGPVDCPLALPTRLKVGDNVVTADNVNLRSAPEIARNIILTNVRNTQLEIIGGPVCGLYQEGAYLWWQVRRADGQVGWSAEAGLTGRLYLLQPVP